MRSAIATLALGLAGSALAQAVTPFSSATPGAAPPRGWSALTFHNVERRTQYELVQDEGATVVTATADASASGWIFRLDAATDSVPVLRWRWKAERLPADGDTRLKRGDDAAARIYVTFRLPPERVSLPQRLLDETARVLYGETPPHASLMYVWDSRAPAGTRMVNPYTNRVRNIVVESGGTRLGRWIAYERDLVADYRAAFGEDPPRLSGVAIMTDADNTGGTAAARYGDVSLSPR